MAATLSATNASDYFTQDLEDYIEVEAIHTGSNPVGTQAAADYVRDQKLQQQRAEQQEQAPVVAAPLTQPALQTPPVPEVAASAQTQSVPAFKGSKTVPEGLQSLWRQMFKPEGRMQVFDMFKANLVKSLGEEEGTRAFYAVLNRHNAKDPRDFNKSLSDARRAAKDMYEIVEPLLAKQAAA